ncbi:MAG: peptide deformylase [Holosporaceae bacterium]|jgi:peptide deformylase|nr:peptide deformylase [Holosporaceae bacterium]
MERELMELLIFPNPILLKKCREVEPYDQEALAVLDGMVNKLYEWNGVGLAAPQVGISKRMVVIDVRGEPSIVYKLINPKIVWKSEEIQKSKEGCLSLPLLREEVARHESVIVEYLDENFSRQHVEATGLLSCCLQHELDHLDGILYIHRLGKLKKIRAIQKFKKLQQELKEQCGGEETLRI